MFDDSLNGRGSWPDLFSRTKERNMKRVTLITVAILITLALLPVTPARAATVWYVAGWAGSDANSCNLPTAACKTINAAIAKAVAGDTIEITAGPYTNPGAPEVVRVTKNLNLQGGWDSSFSNVINYTILNGEHQRRGLVVPAGVSVVVDHMAVIWGQATDGAGVYVQGTFTGFHMVVAQNRALEGAGLYFDNPDPIPQQLWLSESAFYANEYYDRGGGIFINQGDARTANLTISHNLSINSIDEEHGTPPTFGGGLYVNHGYFWGGFDTFSENTRFDGTNFTHTSADVGNGSGTVEIHSSLFADGCTGQINSVGNNLDHGTSCLAIPQVTDFVFTNPQIFTAQGNGGDTITNALAPTSPAIDAGSSPYCGSGYHDQRGVLRPQSFGCDIGAFERQTGDPQMDVIGDCPPDNAGQIPQGSCPPDPRAVLLSVLGPALIRDIDSVVQAQVASRGIAPQMSNPLATKLENAADSLANRQVDDAIDKLNAFINQVQAQRGKKISRIVADDLIRHVQAIIAFITPAAD